MAPTKGTFGTEKSGARSWSKNLKKSYHAYLAQEDPFSKVPRTVLWRLKKKLAHSEVSNILSTVTLLDKPNSQNEGIENVARPTSKYGHTLASESDLCGPVEPFDGNLLKPYEEDISLNEAEGLRPETPVSFGGVDADDHEVSEVEQTYADCTEQDIPLITPSDRYVSSLYYSSVPKLRADGTRKS